METLAPWAEPILMTAEELLRLPDDEWQYDLAEGRLVRMSPTEGMHGRIVMTLLRAVDRFVEERHLGEVFPAETGFRIPSESAADTVLAPDLACVRTGRESAREEEGYPDLAPDLVVEVSIVPKHKDPIAMGERYRVYFMPRYKWLLSIEPLEGPAAGSTGEHTLAALTGHWRPEEPTAGLPSAIEIRPDGTVLASAGALPVSGRLVVLDEHHIRITTGLDDQVTEWHVEVQGDRLRIKLPLHRHVDFTRVS